LKRAPDLVVFRVHCHCLGKAVIFPQFSGLPLTGLADPKRVVLDLPPSLLRGDVWAPETALIDFF